MQETVRKRNNAIIRFHLLGVVMNLILAGGEAHRGGGRPFWLPALQRTTSISGSSRWHPARAINTSSRWTIP